MKKSMFKSRRKFLKTIALGMSAALLPFPRLPCKKVSEAICPPNYWDSRTDGTYLWVVDSHNDRIVKGRNKPLLLFQNATNM